MEPKQEKIKIFLKHIAGQKFTWLALLTVGLVITAFNTRPDADDDFKQVDQVSENLAADPISNTSSQELPVDEPEHFITKSLPEVSSLPAELPLKKGSNLITKKPGKSNSSLSRKLIAYAQSLLGRPYNYGGTTSSGFDCSGFVYHVFSKFSIDIERSSRAQSTQGEEVLPQEVKPGDLVFFTGTNPKIREVGHVGIVISDPGEPVSFVHSSSNGGVKISELEGYYNTRFMFAKRVQ